MIETPIVKHFDEAMQDAFISHSNDITMMMLLSLRNQWHVHPHGAKMFYHL